jgi:hypothetical protein
MPQEHKSLMRSLGEFFGHIVHGVRTDPAKPASRTVVGERTQETQATTPDGQRVILRRTVVEEVEVLPESGGTESQARPSGASGRTQP